MRFFVRALGLALVVMLVVACSSPEEVSVQIKAQQVDREGLLAAAEIVSGAILNADGSTVFVQSTRQCKSETTSTDLNKRLLGTRNNLNFIGVDYKDISITDIEVDKFEEGQSGSVKLAIQATGKSGTALESYVARLTGEPIDTSSGSELQAGTDENAPTFKTTTDAFGFIFEDGSWKLSDCDELLSQSALLTRAGS